MLESLEILCRMAIFKIHDDDDDYSHLCSYYFDSSLANVRQLQMAAAVYCRVNTLIFHSYQDSTLTLWFAFCQLLPYTSAFEDGPDRRFRNDGNYKPDAGELP